MTIPPQYFGILLAAMVYAAGAMLVKRATELGSGAWRTAFVANMVVALFFQPLLLLGGKWPAGLWWQPCVLALCFVAGQIFTFVSLDRGDVSVATPVLGIKILLVAFFVTTLGGESVRPRLWMAAALATLGVTLLNRRTSASHRHVGFTILMAALAAGTFALFDVLVQKWSPAWGLGHFLPITLAIVTVLSFSFMFWFEAPLAQMPKAAWPWLLGGTASIAGQSVLFVSTIALWGHAASVNVVYSSRGLWSVLLVWFAGHWVSSRERELGARTLAWRLAGATLMMSAIVLVLV